MKASRHDAAGRTRLNQYFSAMRVDEFKYTFTAEIQDGFVQKGDWGGFSG